MAVSLKEILYKKDPLRFSRIEETAYGFSQTFIGSNIVQDDIFTVIENYAKTNGMLVEWLRYPIKDRKLCACTFVRGGRIFIMVNLALPLSKQIFAAAHELYHIREFLEEDRQQLAYEGSILQSDTIDEGSLDTEEIEANAFAGILLVPTDDLQQQMRIYQIRRGQLGVKEVLTLMEIFAVPYKAMVIRLMETQVLTEDEAGELLTVSEDQVNSQADFSGKAKRWLMSPSGMTSFGSLQENLTLNTEEELLPQSRLDEDWRKLNELKARYDAG